MRQVKKPYLPAAGRDWLLPLYDPLVKFMGADATRSALVEQAALCPGNHVLDLGCGTGSLTILIRQLYPDATVVGMDPDPKALERARRKAGRVGISVRFDRGYADELPYDAATFDRVFSSLMLHHLPTDIRETALREVCRVLRPGGSLHMVDFASGDGGPGSPLARLVHPSGHLRDNSVDRVLGLLSQAGFVHIGKVRDAAILWGHLGLAYYKATAPEPADGRQRLQERTQRAGNSSCPA